MERVIFENVWKLYDRRYGSNRFRKFLSGLLGRDPERHEFWALRDISFRLEEGHSLGIVGPNGSGKTTILRILSGISQINRGQVSVRGTVAALIALGAGFHPELSGRENIYLNGSILGLKREEINLYLDDIVDFAGIGQYIDSPVKRYSSGMFVRLGFAVAAQVQPDILLVDEVLAVGDARFQSRCHERIAELRQQGTVIVLVSHDLWAIRRSCNDGIFLMNGEIQEQGDIATVLAAYNEHIQHEALVHREERGKKASAIEVATAGCSCDMYFLDRDGKETKIVRLGDPLRARIHYHCEEPVERPVIVLQATAHDGPTAMVLRSRKAGWDVESLSGAGYIDVKIDNLQLNPGRYAFSAVLKDTSDLASLAASPFRELAVETPDKDWCYEAGYYMPDARWEPPVAESR
ncbi:MAG: ABC transporter ATP-binding protein [Candidatus Sumerlaeota bacterium]